MVKIIFTLLIIAFLYISQLDNTISYDEAYTFFAYSVDPLTALLRYTLPNNHQLNSLMIWLTTLLFGDSIIAIRIYVMYCSLITIALVYRIGKRLFSEHAAWLCVILLATQPIFMQYSIWARGYMLSAFLLLCLIYHVCFRTWWGRGNRYYVMTLCAGLMLTLPTMIIAISGCVLWGIIFYRRKIFIKSVAIPAIAGSLAGLLFYAKPILDGAFSKFSGQFGYKTFLALADAFVADYIVVSLSTLILTSLLFLAFWGYKKRNNTILNLLIIQFATFATVICVQFIITGSIIFTRNLFYILPLAILALGQIFLYFEKRGVIVSIFAIILLFLNLQFLPAFIFNPQTSNLVNAIEENAEMTDYIVFGCCQDAPMKYELERRGLEKLIDPNQDYERVIVFPCSV